MPLLYKRISAVDSPFSPTASTLDDLNNNQNSLVLDVDLSGGSVTLNLPSISSLLTGGSNGNTSSGAGAFTFYIKGNIVANVAINTLNIVPANGDTICGASGQLVGGVGTCFHAFIAGRNIWGFFFCQPAQP